MRSVERIVGMLECWREILEEDVTHYRLKVSTTEDPITKLAYKVTLSDKESTLRQIRHIIDFAEEVE